MGRILWKAAHFGGDGPESSYKGGNWNSGCSTVCCM